MGCGRARGAWQMKPETEWDIWNNFLKYDKALARLVTRATSASVPDPYRLHYMRPPLPAAHDVQVQSEYWGIHYNKKPDKGFAWKFVELYYLLFFV